MVSLKYDDVGLFIDGYARVKLNAKQGLIDVNAKEVIPLKYFGLYYFVEDYAVVMSENGEFGFLNKLGEEVIPPKYDLAESFSEGLAEVILDDKHGFVDKTGREIIPLIYDNSTAFEDGVAHVLLKGEWISIDKNGNELIYLEYD